MKFSYHVEFRRIPRQLDFHIFRGTEGSTGHLARVKSHTVCHVSSGGTSQTRAQVGLIGDMCDYMIGWKSKVDGYMDKDNPRNQ